MHRKITDHVLQALCQELLLSRRVVTVRELREELRARYGAAGRTDRIARFLRAAAAQPLQPAAREAADVEQLRRERDQAIARAVRSEELERTHQDYWARRFEERRVELERQFAGKLRERARGSGEQYLALYQRAADLEKRLAQYEGSSEPEHRPQGQAG